MTNYLHKNDLPDNVILNGDVAIDTETKGLNIYQRDRLCVLQISDGNGDAHLVQFKLGEYDKAHNLKKILSDKSRMKILHFARFDIAAVKIFLGVDMENIYCTKIASRLARTYTDKHGLKDLVKELLDVDLRKEAQSSDWGSEKLTQTQIDYAASDVLYLHRAREKLDKILAQENRIELSRECFNFLKTRVELDIKGWLELDIFAH
jgi:ribonuclease D